MISFAIAAIPLGWVTANVLLNALFNGTLEAAHQLFGIYPYDLFFPMLVGIGTMFACLGVALRSHHVISRLIGRNCR
jgi:hypothetical protein